MWYDIVLRPYDRRRGVNTKHCKHQWVEVKTIRNENGIFPEKTKRCKICSKTSTLSLMVDENDS
jgi:hypothetical protein